MANKNTSIIKRYSQLKKGYLIPKSLVSPNMTKSSHCIILAAGKNTRLDKGIPKSLTMLGQESLLERHIRIFSTYGINTFCIVGGYKATKVKQVVPDLADKFQVSIEVLLNDDLDKENGYSMFRAFPWIEEKNVDNFFLSMGDHVFNHKMIQAFIDKTREDTILNLGVDCPGPINSHIDIDDVTKVKVGDNNEIIEIGKSLSDYNWYDTGLFRMNTGVFEILRTNFSLDRYSISHMVEELAKHNQAIATDISGYIWNDVDNQVDLDNTLNLIEKGQL